MEKLTQWKGSSRGEEENVVLGIACVQAKEKSLVRLAGYQGCGKMPGR